MDRRNFIKKAAAGAAAVSLTSAGKSAGAAGADLEARVNEILGRMTLEEKVFQMSGHMGYDVLLAMAPGSHGYTGYTPANKRLSVPAIKCVDGPRGVGFLYKSTCFPAGVARGATWDPDLEARVGEVMGRETGAVGGNMLLAPCINVVRHPSWGRAQESYGEDPLHLGRMGAAHVTGTQKHVMACPKHYAVNNIDQSRMFVNMIVSERTLREIYLPHFKDCVDAGAASIMSAYNDVNGQLCGQNPHLVRDILKGEWGFAGFVVSDWINAVEDTVLAANAGLDLEMPRPEYYGRKLVRAVKNGQVSEAVIDEAVTRILRQKLRFEGADRRDESVLAASAHVALARESAARGCVLLKNEGGILPLKPGEAATIAVVGKFANAKNIGDVGSSVVTPPYIITPLEGIKNKVSSSVTVIHQEGESPEKAAAAAARADVVIVVAGLDSKDEGEGNDRENLDLSADQEKLIQAVAAANKNCVVVLEGGGAITMEAWKDRVPAILMAWYAGMEGGNAMADVLFGDVNPSGKLPVVFPRGKDQLFVFDNTVKEVDCGYYHGYRYFDKQGLEPAFPFGFGLSYTSFQYSNLRLDAKKIGKSGMVTASVDVTNTGGVAGEEIVQLYVGYKGSRVDRPVKDLKAFGKAALDPGRTKIVTLEVSAESLAYYDEQARSWRVEEIEYEVMVGPSSKKEDLALTASFSVSG